MPAPRDSLFAYHANEGAFERLAPPWERIEVIERSGGIRDGARLVMRLRKGPLGIIWDARHFGFVEGERFCDEQMRGPFARWVHTHAFDRGASDEASVLHDHVEWALPGGALGNALGTPMARRQLDRMFAFRHLRTARDLARRQRFADRPRLNVVVTGASGAIGSALVPYLAVAGHTVTRLVRREPVVDATRVGGEAFWDPGAGVIAQEVIDRCDVVIHLAGEPIAGRWTEDKKRRIERSRVEGTGLVAESLARSMRADGRRRAFLSASASGYYGDRPGETLDESSEPGNDFRSRVCVAWEDAAKPARDAGARVVAMRIGNVLGAKTPLLARLLPVWRLGLGGAFGSGAQRWPWIALDDALGAIEHLMHADSIEGPVNLVAPSVVTNREFARTLARTLRRPALGVYPASLLRSVFGEIAQEALLSDQAISARVLRDSGFEFLTPTLDECLRWELGLVGLRDLESLA
jgi:uncharacterized protein (TIGR01777 family)